ncbi:MAG: DNA mismatch repair protein MutS [Bacteroidales bacterium]|nr:DNA mismatch repair protein MutS [Bacteroidales bacterium]
MAKKVETPLMKQYYEMKDKHPDAILLFRVGDFYETFSQDAIDASAILGITLTRRANGSASYVELAGFPHHALDTYLPKLVRAGRRVAICEQLEDPKLTKKLVKRGITELVTPGLNTSENLLSTRENNFLAGVHFGKHKIGVAFLDISTGEFLCAQGDSQYIDKLLANIAPKEVLRMHGTRDAYTELFSHKSSIYELDDWVYTPEAARERLLRQFDTRSLKGFGVEEMPEAQIAAGSILHYLDLTHHERTAHITTLSRIEEDRYVRLDKFTIRNLEILHPMGGEGKALVDIIDNTKTPMGARMLRRWLLFPLLDTAEINSRLDAVDYFFKDRTLRDEVAETLSGMGDMERLTSKVATRRAGPRDLLALKDSVYALCRLKKLTEESGSEILSNLGQRIPDRTEVADAIASAIRPDAPALINRGDVIAEGISEELDSLRSISKNGKAALDNILQREIDATGITSLKIAFNNVFGYYIEVRNTHKDKVPPTWIRKQTLVSAERYITPELKEYEEKIMGAEERISALESEIFSQLLDALSRHIEALNAGAAIAARIDVLLSNALAAEEGRYIRPEVNDSFIIDIREGRHPVIERQLPPGEPYISNSVRLDSDSRQIIMITGPNMSGKSALLRQTALIALLAQTGSFVPAEAASIGIVDKIFTRVGASDNLSMGESTFMVEMNEAAAILNNLSPRSLILFDELGRGTSTYDGISIAWSIVEHIHENGAARPRTLFATHYHELNEMEKSFSRIANFNVAVEEIDGKVVFLRKLRPGGSAHSFGIHVAKLAGMPPSIVKRADHVLRQLEANNRNDGSSAESEQSAVPASKADLSGIGSSRDGYQLSFFQLDDPLLNQIRDRLLNLSIDNLTPLQALTTLHELQALLKG